MAQPLDEELNCRLKRSFLQNVRREFVIVEKIVEVPVPQDELHNHVRQLEAALASTQAELSTLGAHLALHKTPSILSTATSCPSLCSADGSRPHGSFQPAPMAPWTSSRTLGAAFPWILRLVVEFLCVAALAWCCTIHSSCHSCALPPLVTHTVELPDFRAPRFRDAPSQDLRINTYVNKVAETIVDEHVPQMLNNQTVQAAGYPALALATRQPSHGEDDPELPYSCSHSKEVDQEQTEVEKYCNDTANIYYNQDKKDTVHPDVALSCPDKSFEHHSEKQYETSTVQGVGDLETSTKKASILSLATSCSSSCSADGSRAHGSFQPATMTPRTTSWTPESALPWTLWLGVQLLCVAALLWCLPRLPLLLLNPGDSNFQQLSLVGMWCIHDF
eukprot:6491805-Amphidinium_carterae.3